MCECPSFYEESIHRSRKERRCVECGGRIPVGDQYQSAAGLWDGRFDRFVTCMPCAELREQAAEDAGHDCCDRPCFGELREYISYGLPDTAEMLAAIDARRQSGKTASHD